MDGKAGAGNLAKLAGNDDDDDGGTPGGDGGRGGFGTEVASLKLPNPKPKFVGRTFTAIGACNPTPVFPRPPVPLYPILANSLLPMPLVCFSQTGLGTEEAVGGRDGWGKDLPNDSGRSTAGMGKEATGGVCDGTVRSVVRESVAGRKPSSWGRWRCC